MSIKQTLLYLLFLGLFLSCKETPQPHQNKKLFKTRNSFLIDGLIAEGDSDVVYLLDKKGIKLDSTTIKNFKFKLKGSIKKPDLYYVQLNKSSLKTAVILENSHYKLLSSNNQCLIIGGKLHTTFATNQAKKTKFAILKSQYLERFSRLDLGLREYLNKVDSIRKIEKRNLNEFIIENSDNILSILTLKQASLSSKEALKIKNKISNNNQNQRLIRNINTLIDDLKLAEAEDKILRRKPVPLFSGVNPNGKQTSLEKILRGKKLFLIDFWASWCPPCRQASPKLKALYNQYKSKGFDILTVSEDRSVDQWKSGIFLDDIEAWHHIYDDFNRISSMFNVGALPHMVLIDENGKIIKNRISMESLEQELKQTFEPEINDE